MSLTMTIEVPVDFQPLGRCGRRAVAPPEEKPSLPPGRVPRVARLMALALRLEELVRTGQVRNYTELAALGHVTRARISQRLNLIHLAPDIQEALLFLPPPLRGRDAIILANLMPIAAASTGASNDAYGGNCCRAKNARLSSDARRLAHRSPTIAHVAADPPEWHTTPPTNRGPDTRGRGCGMASARIGGRRRMGGLATCQDGASQRRSREQNITARIS